MKDNAWVWGVGIGLVCLVVGWLAGRWINAFMAMGEDREKHKFEFTGKPPEENKKTK